MARSVYICGHMAGHPEEDPGRTIRLSTLSRERPDSRFMQKYPFPESAGCDECRAREGFEDSYFAVPVKKGQHLVDALLEAAQRLGGPLYALAIATAQGELDELRTRRDAEWRGEDRLGVSNQVAP